VNPQGEKAWVEIELPKPPPLDFLPEGLDRMEGFINNLVNQILQVF